MLASEKEYDGFPDGRGAKCVKDPMMGNSFQDGDLVSVVEYKCRNNVVQSVVEGCGVD